MAAPSQAQHHQSQHQQQHQATNSGHSAKPAQHYSPALSQSQMSNMLDEVSSGKAPTLPAHSKMSANSPSPHSMTGMRPLSGNIVRPPAGGLINHGGMGVPHLSGMMSQGMGMPHGGGMGMSHGLTSGGLTRPPGMGMGMGMGTAGHGMMGHGMMPMGTMGGAAGMAHNGMTGGGAAQFMQQFKQKFGALMPGAMGGEQEGGESGGMGGMPGGMGGLPGGMGGMPGGMGGMPGGMGGMPGGGGGMQAQLMQRLFQGQAPGGGAARPMSNFPGNRSLSRPISQSQDDVIKRPPGLANVFSFSFSRFLPHSPLITFPTEIFVHKGTSVELHPSPLRVL
jgi:hypothetical protein